MKDQVKLLLSNVARLDPLSTTVSHMNCLQAAAFEGKVRVTKTLIKHFLSVYKVDRDPEGGKEKLQQAINSFTKDTFQTALHIAVIKANHQEKRYKNYEQVIKLLLCFGANPLSYDLKCWCPSDYCVLSSILSILNNYESKLIQEKAAGISEELKSKKQKVSLNQLMRLYSFDYQFCIISKATDIDPINNIVFRQLINLKKTLTKVGKMDVKCFYEIFNSRSEFIFVVRLDRAIINHYVDNLDYTIFNIARKYHATFLEAKFVEFEPIKDYYSRNIILMILLSEFNIYHFKEEGLVTDFFNLHEFHQLRNVTQFWRSAWLKTFANPFSLEPSIHTLRFDTSTALYYGCSIGLFFAFVTHYLDWLLVPGAVGLVVSVVTNFTDVNLFILLILLNSILLSLWIPFLMTRWEQKESRLSYMWTTHLFEKEEQPRREYTGIFKIDHDSKEVTQEARVSSFQKRASTEWLLFLLAMAMIVAWFNAVTYLNQQALQLQKKKLISDNVYLVAGIAVTLLNVIVVKILNLAYLFLTRKIVEWENHKYQSAADNSLILKNFFFQFFNAYIYLVYYIIVDQKQIAELRLTFITTMVASLLSQVALVGRPHQKFLLPYGKFLLCVRKFRKKWRKFHSQFYVIYYKQRREKLEKEAQRRAEEKERRELEEIDDADKNAKVYLTKELAQEVDPNKYATDYEEEDHILHEQIEFTLCMDEEVNQQDAFTELVVSAEQAIQYGFSLFFNVVAPFSCIIVLAVNVAAISLYTWRFTVFTKRSDPKPASSIGVWIIIFKVRAAHQSIGYIGLVVNPFLFWFLVVTGRLEFTAGKLDLPEVWYLPLVILIEHGTFIFAFVTTKLLSVKGDWVENQQKIEEYYQSQDQEKVNLEQMKKIKSEYSLQQLWNSLNLQAMPDKLKDD